MKQTRKVFVLNGYTAEEEEILLNELCFKALTIFHSKEVTFDELVDVFKHNKNALCISCTLPGAFMQKAIKCNDLKTDANLVRQFQDIADCYNCDIGDHKSNSSGLNSSPTIGDCAYCNQIKGICSHQHKVLYSSPNFFVFSTLGQFTNGYLLIIPYSHIMSNAELPEYKCKEFFTVLEDITYILKLTYNVSNVLVWENGTGNLGIGKAKDSVVHAHTHIAPSNLDAKKIEVISGFPFKEITFEELSNYKEHSYLLIKGDSNSTWQICQDSQLYIPRQYVRQLLAEEYCIPGECWNWRTHPYEEKMHETDSQIIDTLRKNWDQLPQRIKDRTRNHLF